MELNVETEFFTFREIFAFEKMFVKIICSIWKIANEKSFF